VRRLAQEADAIGTFDAVIHNAGIGFRETGRNATEDGHARTLAVNAPAPYLSWDGRQAYADSKLFDATLAAAMARPRPDTVATSVTPGWVATKMGGAGAWDDLEAGSITQAWLAVSDDPEALHSGALPYHQAPRHAHPAVADEAFGDRLLDAFGQLTGVPMP